MFRTSKCPSSGRLLHAVLWYSFHVFIEAFWSMVGRAWYPTHPAIVGRVAQWCSDWLRAGRAGDRIPVGARFSSPFQNGPGVHTTSCTMGTGSFPGVKSGRSVMLTPHLLLVLWSRKSRAIPLPSYGPYGLYRAPVPVQECTLPYFTSTSWLHCHFLDLSIKHILSSTGLLI